MSATKVVNNLELNPNHGVTQEMRDQWHKIALIIMVKQGLTEVRITPEDIERACNGPLSNIVVDSRAAQNDFLLIRLVNDKEAWELAKKHGGLPV